MSNTIGDVLGKVGQVNQQIPPLLMELLNEPNLDAQAAKLRELGQHLGSLSAECLARAAEVDGSGVEITRVVIDAQD